MNEQQKKDLLKSILKSDKIKIKYEPKRIKYHLNRELIASRIMQELEPLWKRFHDQQKLQNFLESFIANHLDDFLIKRKKEKDLNSRDTTISYFMEQNQNQNQNQKEIPKEEENPQERFLRELEERKQLGMNISIPSTPSPNPPTPTPTPMNNPFLTQPQPQVQQQIEPQTELVKSMIHMDSRDRILSTNPKPNPMLIQMESSMNCLISVHDLMIENVYNDPYLLVSVEEAPKGFYESQMPKEIHFKLKRIEKTDSNSYYKNIYEDTMIQLKNVSKITFYILRPNGQVLYQNIQDILPIELMNDEQLNDENHCLIKANTNGLIKGDKVILFNDSMKTGNEFEIVALDKKMNQILCYTMETKKDTYSYMMIQKCQISLTLEIM